MNPSEAIAALREAGWSEVAIAKEVGSTQPTINRIGRGVTQPNYPLGKALVELAAREATDSHRRPAANGEGGAASNSDEFLDAA